MNTNLAEKKETQALVSRTPADLLAIAVEQGADLEKLKQLMDLQERWEKNEARKAWVSAMNDFKANPPELFKNKTVSFGDTSYTHASLDHVVKAIAEGLSRHGLSHRWIVEQMEGGAIKVTCIITHVMGHSEATSLQAGADQSGKKNNIQAIGSTVTYLERYTLLAATGLAAKGLDDDAAKGAIEFISEEQAADINTMLVDAGADKGKFLEYFKIGKIEELPVKAYNQAVSMIKAKQKAKK